MPRHPPNTAAAPGAGAEPGAGIEPGDKGLPDPEVCRQARLVFLNAGEIPMAAEQAASLLLGQIPSPELLEAAARLAAEIEIEPLGDLHASEAYKKQLAFVLGKRTLAIAVARAQKKIAGQPT